MPCHEETYPARADKNQLDCEVLVDNGKIRVREMGNDFYGQFPTVKEHLNALKKKHKTFKYKVHGTMIVVITPCPHGC